MKLLFYVLLLPCLIHSQTWTQLTDFSGNERDDGVAVVINNMAYVGTGLANGTGISNDFHRLNLSTNTWSLIAAMPVGTNRQYASAFTYSNYLFVTCGITNGNVVLNDTYRYDVAANTWTTGASKPGSAVWGACSFILNNKAFISGGKFSNGNVSDEVWEYDMALNTWTQKNNFPFGGRWRASAAVLNTTPYMIFGLDNNGSGSYRKEIYKYSQATDVWTKVADFPQPNKGRVYTAMQALNNKLVIFGGHDSTGLYFNDVWFFDEINGFVPGPAMPSLARKGGMSFAYGNKFYYTCGLNSAMTRVKETWLLEMPVGLKENNKDAGFSVYPNPFINSIIINSENNSRLTAELYNLTGEQIMITAYEGGISLDLSQLSKGVYMLKLKSADGWLAVKKIVKDN